METTTYEITGDILTFYIESDINPQAIDKTFTKFGELLHGFGGRQVYGVSGCIDDKLRYLTCVTENHHGEAADFKLPYYAIPNGKYICTTLKNWRRHLPEINGIFHQLMQHPDRKENTICLEYYKNDEEALLMVQHK